MDVRDPANPPRFIEVMHDTVGKMKFDPDTPAIIDGAPHLDTGSVDFPTPRLQKNVERRPSGLVGTVEVREVGLPSGSYGVWGDGRVLFFIDLSGRGPQLVGGGGNDTDFDALSGPLSTTGDVAFMTGPLLRGRPSAVLAHEVYRRVTARHRFTNKEELPNEESFRRIGGLGPRRRTRRRCL